MHDLDVTFFTLASLPQVMISTVILRTWWTPEEMGTSRQWTKSTGDSRPVNEQLMRWTRQQQIWPYSNFRVLNLGCSIENILGDFGTPDHILFVHVQVYMCANVHAPMCEFMWRPEDHPGYYSLETAQLSFCCCLRQGLSLGNGVCLLCS